jgi:acylphosphatase
MDDKLLYRIHINGWVQGVGFRWRTSLEANRLGLKGYVRNLRDGRVYIEAEGTREQLENFVGWCKKGPGVVKDVNVEAFPPAGYKEFRIEH